MSIFKQRMMRPNQLATLRELESKVDMGKVLWCEDHLAIITGLNPDAPLGTKLTFVSGGTGVLLWHRSDNLAFALVLGGAQNISAGEGVECKILGVIQLVDESAGPVTKKDFELWRAPTGDTMFGHVVDYLGRPVSVTGVSAALAGESAPLGQERTKPLINQQVAMKNREQITESMLTGVKAVDVLTPLGRGASLLVIGPQGSGKTSLALDAVLAQRGTGVRCVYAAVGRSAAQLKGTLDVLSKEGALPHSVVVHAPPDAPLGEKYAALCLACSIGERVRDEGGHSLVIMDEVSPLMEIWEKLVLALADLGVDKVREGLIKDAEGRDVALTPQNEQQLQEYEGMLVSGAAAQRRGFFSTLFMRAAKMHSSFGGGSMSLLLLIAGRPATGSKVAPSRLDPNKYSTISAEQLQRMQAALDARVAASGGPVGLPAEGEMKTEAVEEFISISDGQVVLEAPRGDEWPYVVNPRLSITRVGTRAYYRAMATLAPQIRLLLAQAEDARRFAGAVVDPQLAKADAHTQRLEAVLRQRARHPVPLEEQVVLLYAVQNGYVDAVPATRVGPFLDEAVAYLRSFHRTALAEVAATKQLTAAAEKSIADGLAAFCRVPASK